MVCQTTIASEPSVIAEVLRAQGLPAIVIDATHAAAALRTGFRNATDRNDARGIADLMRVKKYRPVWVKSPKAQRERNLLAVRDQLRRQALDLRNAAWSTLQAEGLRPPKLARAAFEARLAAALNDPSLAPALVPLVRLTKTIEKELAQIDRSIAAMAKVNDACRLLKTVPDVGPLVALTHISGMDDAGRPASSPRCRPSTAPTSS